MRSIPAADYARLPKLRLPAAYICVIRDVDRDRYRFQATNQPRSLIEAVFAERTREFGIELLSILESDNIAESEARLYERHHATLGEDWLTLDTYQLRELHRSELQLYAHRSHYISPDEIPTFDYAQPTDSDLPPLQGSASHLAQQNRLEKAQRSNRQSTLGSNRYGARSLRRRGKPLSASEVETDHRRRPIRQAIDEAITDLWTNHPWKCLAALALKRCCALTRCPKQGSAEPLKRLRRCARLLKVVFKHLLWNDPGCLLLIWIGLLLAGLAYICFVSIGAWTKTSAPLGLGCWHS